MSGKLLDSNILIYLSKKLLSFEKIAVPGDKIYISVITYMEVLGYRFSGKTEKQIIEELCRNLPVINLDKDIIDRVIQLRQNNKIKLPDAIIASTALSNNLELVTANADDFLNLTNDLVVINPFK